MTIIRSGNTLLACGDNGCRQISNDRQQQFTTPTPLDLPGPVVKIVYSWNCILVQLTDGAWVGQGKYRRDIFIPVPKADLIDGDFLPGWSPVNGVYAKELNAQKTVDDVMILPEPIT